MLKILNGGLFAGALVIAAPVTAAPIFLTCQMTQPSGATLKVDIQMNEDAGRVTYSFPDQGNTYTVPGFFTANEVKFGAFTVSRSDLSFKRMNNDSFSKLAGDPAQSDGTCAVSKVSRAF